LGSRLGECREFDQVILRHGLEVTASFAPGGEASDDHERVESIFPQYVRHPGARGFAGSSTVQVNILVLWEILHLFFEIVGLDADRAQNALSPFVVVPVAAYVDDQHAIDFSSG